jgi:hypothetical protein
MPDQTMAFRTLLRAISDLKEGTPVHADTVREAFDATSKAVPAHVCAVT